MADGALNYLAGFDHQHQTEALPGALPVGQFSPQRPAYRLYAEQHSATAFTAPRADNRRTWLYRIRPSVRRGAVTPLDLPRLRAAPDPGALATPEPLRWDPLPPAGADVDFVDGLVTFATAGDVRGQRGIAVHLWSAGRSMQRRALVPADGEWLLVPQHGAIRLETECGWLDAAPGSIAVVPRGMPFRVELPDGASRGYACENHGAPFRLPERGPVGANGFANERDFEYPVAAFRDVDEPWELVHRFGGRAFVQQVGHCPFDVVAWTGNCAPYRYDLARFNAMGTIGFDHPDPSIFTVLSAPSDLPGTANVDFVIFPPRWMVAEHTFRPPYFHRNVMSEFMGLVHGRYDAREAGFVPGGASLHNAWVPHGPEPAVHARASAVDLQPERLDATLAFMFESRYVLEPTPFAQSTPLRQRGYAGSWAGLARAFDGTP